MRGWPLIRNGLNFNLTISVKVSTVALRAFQRYLVDAYLRDQPYPRTTVMASNNLDLTSGHGLNALAHL